MTLSTAQQEVIDYMKNGWELGKYSGFHASIVLQKGGLGKGGETKRGIRITTLYKLIDLELIKKVGGWQPEKYALTEKGKEMMK